MTRYLLMMMAFSIASFSSFYATNPNNNGEKYVEDGVHRKDLFFAELPVAKQIALLQGYLKRNNIDVLYIIRNIIFLFVFMPPLNSRGAQYQGKNFVGLNLSGRDFTNANLEDTDCSKANLLGAIFKNTNVTGIVLFGAKLTHTECNYVGLCKKYIKEATSCEYIKNIFNDIVSITHFYLKVDKDVDKATLLRIACGLAHLPYDQALAFYVSMQYWSYKLLCFRDGLVKNLGDQLLCSFGNNLNYDATNYCWETDYPQDKITCRQAVHILKGRIDFDGYLKQFRNGLVQYKVKSANKYGFFYYKEAIESSIQRLAQVYKKITHESLQKNMGQIAYGLSKSYELKHRDFLGYFLHHQYLLVRVGNEIKKCMPCYDVCLAMPLFHVKGDGVDNL